MNKQQSYDNLAQLVEKFATNLNEYKVKNYNEAQARVDFINPFFELLGWDINNRKGMPESYRDVIYEDKLRIGGSVKAPDYCFTINGNRKFFVEAKKPIISLKDKIEPAYQLRRYGWSAKMPISLLTDFEELSLYDCSLKPNPYDGAFVSRLRYLTYNDYLKEFNFLWDVFSREQIEKGSLAQFINANVSKANRSSVDSEFLKSLDKWRDLLAHDLVKMNDNLDEDQLNYSLQKIVDRIVFLRICEDRGVEQDEQLFKAIKLSDVYDRLRTIFHTADQKYNSGLFDYNKDKITDNLKVGDMVLRNIIQEMYFPICPYEFSVIPVEILGHSYEQYLGKVIKITPSHDITIEEKPEVRKAGGVYYTPQYIVDYIVKNTVGKLVENKTPEEVSKLKICDPACGSGSFLLGAYQFLLNWHLDYYTANPHKTNPLTPDGNLTTQIKKQILLNNIYGVDIDTNAVEVTKLSLMLKALEGETKASINHQLSWFHDRILPTLDDNIKSGNSLIDIDFYESQLDFEPGQEKKIKPFNWESAFPTVFKQGGFDAVIGNPPYVRQEGLLNKNYYLKKFKVYNKSADLFYMFVEKATSISNIGAYIGMILSNRFTKTNSGEQIREFISDKQVISLINFNGIQVFQDANVDTLILLLRNTRIKNENILVVNVKNFVGAESFTNYIKANQFPIQSIFVGKNSWSFNNNSAIKLKEKISNIGIEIGKIKNIKVNRGITTGLNDVFIVNQTKRDDLVGRFPELNDILIPIIKGANIKRYSTLEHLNYLIFTYKGIDIYKYKNIFLYLNDFKSELSNVWGAKNGSKEWYELRGCSYYDSFAKEKIIYTRLSSLNDFTMSFNKEFCIDSSGIINSDDNKYYLAILNSKLILFYIKQISVIWGKDGIKWFGNSFDSIPLKIIDFTNINEASSHAKISRFVEVLLELNSDLKSATLPEQKEHIQQRINYTDKQIDKLVYELYELTEEEIKIVEGEG